MPKKPLTAKDLLQGRKRFVRKSGRLGGATIVRDSYSNAFGSWFDTIKRIKNRDGNRGVGRLSINGKTVRCSETTALHVHHILPLSRGGRTIDANLVTLCERCHSRRHSHMEHKHG